MNSLQDPLRSLASLQLSLSLPLPPPVRIRTPRMGRKSNNTRGMLVVCLFLSAAILHCESFTTRPCRIHDRPNISRPRRVGSAAFESLASLHAVGQSNNISNENGAAAPPSASASASAKKRRSTSATTTTERKETQGSTRKRRKANNSKSTQVVGGYLKYSVLMDHDILTKQQEQELGTAVQLAQMTQAALDVLLEQKREARRDKIITYNTKEDSDDDEDEDEEQDYLCYLYSDHNDEDDTAEALSRISSGVARMEDQERQSLLPAPWRDADDNDSNTLEDELHMLLSDQEVAAVLNIEGGRSELHSILVQGALARETLIRSNVKLVVSIAKRWAQQAARGSGESARAIYAGGRDRPSLDEAIQEGILGLTTAADRFDPGRGLRFSTYATHWVTNSVRQCFQTSSVGMRVPMGYHDARSKFRTLVKNYYDVHGETPDFETLADEMNIKVGRLHLILRMTKPTLSIDGPLTTSTFTRAGQAGGSEYGNAPQIKDMLEDRDCRPEDRVELSFLRQSLENAMAQELAPHERDIVRLRLGLDDGVSMTTKEVAVACGGGLSISDVRMAEKRAFQKLRSPHALATYKFLAYLDFAGVDAATMKLR